VGAAQIPFNRRGRGGLEFFFSAIFAISAVKFEDFQGSNIYSLTDAFGFAEVVDYSAYTVF